MRKKKKQTAGDKSSFHLSGENWLEDKETNLLELFSQIMIASFSFKEEMPPIQSKFETI